MKTKKTAAIIAVMAIVSIAVAVKVDKPADGLTNEEPKTILASGVSTEANLSHYLIIYAHIFHNNGYLNGFVGWKSGKGLDVTLVDQNTIVTDQNRADYAEIRDYIRNSWWDPEWENPAYVLLVGDVQNADRSSDVAISDDSHIAAWYNTDDDSLGYYIYSDYYYQQMDDNDHYGDIALGRWCAEDASQLATYVMKTLAYEKPALTEGWAANRALLVACMDDPTGGQMAMEFDSCTRTIETEILPTQDYSVATQYGSDTTNLTVNNFMVRYYIEANNSVGIINYLGRPTACGGGGSWGEWNIHYGFTESITPDTVRTFNQSVQQAFPIVFSENCDNGHIAVPNSESMVEAWTRNPNGGGVAACGPNECHDPPPKCILDTIAFKELFQNDLDCGFALNEARKALWAYDGEALTELYGSNPSSWELLCKAETFQTMWIGDPDLDVWRGQPHPATITMPSCSPPNILNVYVRSGGGGTGPGVPGAKVCMYGPGTPYHLVEYTDQSGYVGLPYPNYPGTYIITATNQKGPVCIIPADTFFTVGPWSSPRTDVEESPAPLATWQLESISPNPMRTQTTISYSVGGMTASELKLSVYDASGREVRVLASGSQAPGHHEASWDKRDAAGAECAAGVYFVRIQSREFNANQRIVLVK